jgi:hypothetical protein
METSMAHEFGQNGFALVLARNFSPMWLSRHSDLDFEGCAHDAKFAARSDDS